MKTRYLFLALLLVVTSCGSVKETTTETTTETTKTELVKDSTFAQEKHILRDTIIKLEADSTWLKASLECDSNNNVILKEIEQLRSGNKIKLNFTFKDGDLEVKNKINEDSITVYWKEYYRKEYVELVHKLENATITDSKKKEVKKQSLFSVIKWILLSFVVGLVIGLTKKYWIKLIRGF
ncbi:MAG: hypothetical protein QM503_03800 [Bacteroidota bacterium]